MFWRGLGIAGALSVIVWAVEGREGVRNIFRFGPRRLLGAALLVVVSHCFIWALALTAAANVLVVLAGSPLAAAIIGRLFLGEPVPVRTWIAAVAVAGGIAVIFADDLEGGRFAGNLCAAIATVGLAAYFVLLRSIRAASTLPVPIWGNLAAAAVALPFASPFSVPETGILWLALMACLLLPAGIGLISTGPRYIPAAEVGLLLLLETLLGPLWVWLGTGRDADDGRAGGGRCDRCGARHELGSWATLRRPQGDAAMTRPAMIVAAQPEAAEAGARVLQRGGNAVDAAIAAALVQGARRSADVRHSGLRLLPPLPAVEGRALLHRLPRQDAARRASGDVGGPARRRKRATGSASF